MLKEVCVENFTNVPLMIERGAERIELNNDLANGGTTPSFGVIKKTVEYAHKYNVPVIVMIRPRSGNFVYTADELEIMNSDIRMCSLLKADGIAFGCLTNNKQLDKIAMKKLITTAHAGNLEVVMHMAFDELNKQAEGKIEILPGGGITDKNVNSVIEKVGVTQAHGTKILGKI